MIKVGDYVLYCNSLWEVLNLSSETKTDGMGYDADTYETITLFNARLKDKQVITYALFKEPYQTLEQLQYSFKNLAEKRDNLFKEIDKLEQERMKVLEKILIFDKVEK